MKVNAIVTGSTGMVGKGVLLECLENPQVESVLVINRRPLGMEHSKLKEIIHEDFHNFENLKNRLKGYNACFFCLGVSSIGMSEEEYTRISYAITKSLAAVLENNKDMVFNYVSGEGTDSAETGKMMWARVKGRTENMLLNMKFKNAFMFRPGFIIPGKGTRSKTIWVNAAYMLMRPFFGLLKKLNSVTTTRRMGRAMINSVLHPEAAQGAKILKPADINRLASLDG